MGIFIELNLQLIALYKLDSCKLPSHWNKRIYLAWHLRLNKPKKDSVKCEEDVSLMRDSASNCIPSTKSRPICFQRPPLLVAAAVVRVVTNARFLIACEISEWIFAIISEANGQLIVESTENYFNFEISYCLSSKMQVTLWVAIGCDSQRRDSIIYFTEWILTTEGARWIIATLVFQGFAITLTLYHWDWGSHSEG